MLKKVINYLLLISVIHLIFAPFNRVLAAGDYSIIEQNDPQNRISSIQYEAVAPHGGDSVRIGYIQGSFDSVVISSWTDTTFSNSITVKNTAIASTDYATHLTCNRPYTAEFYKNGSLVSSLKLNVTGLVSPTCNSGGEGETPDPGTGGSGGDCIGCDLFNCPGWSQYMGKLEEIKSAIPPAPNWPEVAATFRDTIAPQIKADMQEILGTAPTPPAAPEAPAPPAMPSDLDDKGITAPTGENAPGLDNSTFSSDDIKSEAPVIEVREDPTGGFQINNPVNTLPSQDEFKQNIPVEGEAPFPAAPAEPINTAPTPSEPINTAPTPTEPTNIAPTPSEPINTAPTPGDTTETAPLPGDTTETAPIPIEEGTAPLPSNTTGTAPLPS